jgi:hypothetical protein
MSDFLWSGHGWVPHMQLPASLTSPLTKSVLAELGEF